jgi:ribosomal protein S27AE
MKLTATAVSPIQVVNTLNCSCMRCVDGVYSAQHDAQVQYFILSRVCGVCDYRRGLDWSMDLLTNYTHHSELQLQRYR